MNKLEIVDNEYVKIYLKDGHVGFFDIEFLEAVNEYKWRVISKSGNYYITTTQAKNDGKRDTIYLHRLIMGSPEGKVINHEDHNGLNCRKYNLTICSNAENVRYQNLSKANTSGYKGVHWYKRGSKWQARIKFNNKKIHLGYFENKIDAAKAYNDAAIKYFGKFAVLNVI